MIKNTRQEIIYMLANDIRNSMQSIAIPYSDNYSFETIKNITNLIDELLSDEILKEDYIKELKKLTVNSANIEEKLETFQMIRNLIIHFPFFKCWDDIYINYDLLNWNKPKFSSIKKYFAKNNGKRMTYKIYTRLGESWTHEHTVDFVVPTLYKSKKTYLRDIITAEDMFWTFSLIDSLLEYMGIGIISFSHYSV